MPDKKLKVLIIEDSDPDYRLVFELIRESPPPGFEASRAKRLSEASDALRSAKFDALLVDLNLPDCRGLETLDRLTETDPSLPIVVLTGLDDAELGVEALHRKAQDYLVKGQIDSGALRRSLRYAIERKAAEQALLRAKEEWERTFDSVPDLIAILDNQHRIVRANQAMARKLGVPASQCVGMPCYERVHGSGGPPAFCPHLLTLADGEEHVSEVHEERLGGDFLVSTTPLRDAAGKIVGAVHVARDITERKRMEEALRRSHDGLEKKVRERTAELRLERDRLQTLLDSMSDEVWAVDAQGNIVLANRAALANVQELGGVRVNLGRPASGLVSGLDMHTPDRKMGISGYLARLLSGEAIRDLGLTVRNKKTGEICYRQASATPIRDRKGKVTGAVALIRDVTETRRLEEELKKREENLRRAKRMEALGTLAGGISHDFNNLLSTIVINTEMALLDLDERSRAQNYLPLVLQAASRGRELVDQIITFSRHKERDLKPLSVRPILKEALKFVRSNLPKNIELREQIATDSDVILGDPSQIHQVLMNLCKNAVEAMEDGGGVLDVRLDAVEVDAGLAADHPDLRPGTYVRLKVGDSGHGMSAEVRERIFDPFFTTKGPGKGSGMGLAVVHGIIKGYGGAIVVDS